MYIMKKCTKSILRFHYLVHELFESGSEIVYLRYQQALDRILSKKKKK